MVARAKHHLADFKAQISTYDDSEPFINVCDYDPDADENVYKIKLAKPIPVMLNGIASDAVCNLRSALDHAGYAASIGASLNGKDTHFPFGDTYAEVRSRKTGGSKDIPDEIFYLMESFQPYERGDSILWSLNKLANANKHRILVAMAIAATGLRIKEMTLTSTGPGRLGMTPLWDRAKNEMVIAAIQPTPNFKFEYEVEIITNISFGEVEVVYGHPADGVLDALIGKVDRILLAVEAEGRRIGIFR